MFVSLFDRKRAGNISETLRIAWPLMLSQVANALYDICDGYFLANVRRPDEVQFSRRLF
jgi:Na+-driven multidrug efflux pump